MTLNNYKEEHRTEILQTLLEQFPFQGWTQTNLQNISRDLGHSDRLLIRLFPNGLRDVIDGQADLLDRKMLKTIDPQELKTIPIRNKISKLVFARISAMSSCREASSRLFPLLYTPQYLPTGTKILWRTVDLMWRTVGDTSTDFNYYSKRSLLAGVYCSTLLCWLTDDSDNYSQTESFLDRRIANVMSLQKIKPRVKDHFPGILRPLSSLRELATTLRRANQ